MGSMLRSDRMTFCHMYIQPETAFEIISRLGEMGCVQFVDMNPDLQAFQRSYVAEVRRCAELERILRYIQDEMIKDNIYVPELKSEPAAMPQYEMNTLENVVEKWENDIQEISGNYISLSNVYQEMAEMNYVLNEIGPILGDAEIQSDSLFYKGKGETFGHLEVLSGVVRRSASYYFEMMLWRICRGNIYFRYAAQDQLMRNPYTGHEVRKVAFLVICQGEQLRSRMEKVCAGFRASLYPCPETQNERMDISLKLELRLLDLEQVLKKTKYHRCKLLRTIGKQWRMWMIQVKKSKAVYHTMNLFSLDITKGCLIGQCWVPDDDLRRVQETLDDCSETMGSNVSSFITKSDIMEIPPTYHRTNKFTNGFQVLINAYGDSTYRELNPGLYTIVTFPFLFAVMFGDVGHGSIMLCFALWMVITEKQHMNTRSNNEIWSIFFGGRYIILLMAIFSCYTGVLYNDWFSRPVMLGNSRWKVTTSKDEFKDSESVSVDPLKDTSSVPYVMGVDPIWTFAKNKIIFENSIKMKLSIIIGVAHMMFGLFLSLLNHIYFKRYYAIILEFLPQILFLMCLFLWLVILIYLKWWKYSGTFSDHKTGSSCAPLVLLIFIDMVLMSEPKPVNADCDAYILEGQNGIQNILILICALCVPIMLFGTPLYLSRKHHRMKKNAPKASEFRRYQRRDSERKESKQVEPDEHSGFGDLIIHQGIHVIEFCLSTISHTASYLRLWALSLAHAQLSEMLWSMVLSKMALSDTSMVGSIKLFLIFGLWAFFTMAIMVLMEGLSAFLHTLRLHWVEFMSKFYQGLGYKFQPFSFKLILSED